MTAASRPILHVFRGLPGSGKSTAANKLGCLVFSPQDMVAMKGNQYQYDPSNIDTAGKAMGDVLKFAARYRMDIAIAEVLPKREQVRDLAKWARDTGYELRVHDLKISMKESITRNTHNARIEDIKAMVDAWQPWRGGKRFLYQRPSPIKDGRSSQRLKGCSLSDLLAGMLGLAVAVETAIDLDENAVTAARLRQLVIELRNRVDPKPLGVIHNQKINQKNNLAVLTAITDMV